MAFSWKILLWTFSLAFMSGTLPQIAHAEMSVTCTEENLTQWGQAWRQGNWSAAGQLRNCDLAALPLLESIAQDQELPPHIRAITQKMIQVIKREELLAGRFGHNLVEQVFNVFQVPHDDLSESEAIAFSQLIANIRRIDVQYLLRDLHRTGCSQYEFVSLAKLYVLRRLSFDPSGELIRILNNSNKPLALRQGAAIALAEIFPNNRIDGFIAAPEQRRVAIEAEFGISPIEPTLSQSQVIDYLVAIAQDPQQPLSLREAALNSAYDLDATMTMPTVLSILDNSNITKTTLLNFDEVDEKIDHLEWLALSQLTLYWQALTYDPSSPQTSLEKIKSMLDNSEFAKMLWTVSVDSPTVWDQLPVYKNMCFLADWTIY
ncbi:hypothetical protein FLX56_05050 [Synechococcus moorigangaii CMS01]|nr:hypothetical protein [Synechococcus moorigangaii CMS01]